MYQGAFVLLLNCYTVCVLMNLCNKQYEWPKAEREDARSSAQWYIYYVYGNELATWPVYECLSTIAILSLAVSHLALLFHCQ